MKTTFTVTHNHIRNGVPRECAECPVALSVSEKSSAFRSVGQDGITFWDSKANDYQEYPVPDSVRMFIQDYDEGKDVAEFSFELDIPEEFLN